MAAPIIYGPAFSTYVRTVRLTLEEKPASYELVDVAMMKGAHKEPEHLARNPFGKVPAFSDDGFDLYETDAIVRYIDQAIPGQDLQPVEAKPRARMNQIIGIIESVRLYLHDHEGGDQPPDPSDVRRARRTRRRSRTPCRAPNSVSRSSSA